MTTFTRNMFPAVVISMNILFFASCFVVSFELKSDLNNQKNDKTILKHSTTKLCVATS